MAAKHRACFYQFRRRSSCIWIWFQAASEKGFRLVYINLVNGSLHKQFSLKRYLPVFITRVDDQQAFLYNFPLTRFLSLNKFSWTSFGCVCSAFQLAECCEKLVPVSCWAKERACWMWARRTFACEKQGRLKALMVGLSVNNRKVETKSRIGQ